MAIPSREILSKLENSGVKSTRPLIPPQILQEDLPLYVSFELSFLPCIQWIVSTLQAAETVLQGRLAVQNVLSGDDDRLIVVVG
jgi:3-deoxy-7-phosphoheptulonate synthase